MSKSRLSSTSIVLVVVFSLIGIMAFVRELTSSGIKIRHAPPQNYVFYSHGLMGIPIKSWRPLSGDMIQATTPDGREIISSSFTIIGYNRQKNEKNN